MLGYITVITILFHNNPKIVGETTMEAWLVVAFILLTLTLLLVPIMHIINKARTNLVDIIEDEINSLEEQPTTYEEAI